MKRGKNMRALFILLVFVLASFLSYYLLVIKPVDAAWNHCISVMAGKTVPEANDEAKLYYRLDKDGYQHIKRVDLTVHRFFLFRWQNRIKMTVKYSQKYYDEDGNLIYQMSNAAQWVFAKKDGVWFLYDIISVQP